MDGAVVRTDTYVTYRCPTCKQEIGLTIQPVELPLCIADHPLGRRKTVHRLMLPVEGEK